MKMDPESKSEKNNAQSARLNQVPPHFSSKMVTADGKNVTIRPITCADKDKLREFHTQLSGETRYLRYQYLKGDLTDSDLDSFCNVDYWNTLGLVAEKGMNGRKNIVGVGRYVRLDDPQFAEMAFVVRDDEQRKGIGTQLLRHLAELAGKRGIRYFVGELLRENTRMISIFRKSDPTLNQSIEGSSCTVVLKVEDAKKNTPVDWKTKTCSESTVKEPGNKN